MNTDGYYLYYIMFVFNLCEETISRTDEGQPRPKYIFNKCGTNIYFFTLQAAKQLFLRHLETSWGEISNYFLLR